MSKANDTRASGSREADPAESRVLDRAVSDSSASSGIAGRGSTDSMARRSRHASAAAVDAVPKPGRERESRTPAKWIRADSDGADVEPSGQRWTDGEPGRVREPLPGGRRDRRRQQTEQAAVVTAEAVLAGAPSEGVPAPRVIEDMSLEEALVAGKALGANPGEHAITLLASGTNDPFDVDLAVLAQQKALAERAAILNSRARRMQEFSKQDQQSEPAPNDPTTPHNLSILAPPELVRVPGGAQAFLQAPTTFHVLVVVPRPEQALVPPTAREGSGAGARSASIAGAAGEPIEARNAFGLEPLDAMTAGLRRLRHVRYIQYSLLGVGAAGVSTGIIMTVSSLNG